MVIAMMERLDRNICFRDMRSYTQTIAMKPMSMDKSKLYMLKYMPISWNILVSVS